MAVDSKLRGEDGRIKSDVKTKPASNRPDLWFKAPKGNVHKQLFQAIEHLDTNQPHRTNAMLKYIRLYGGTDGGGLTPGSYSKIQPLSTDRIRLNVIQSVTDAVTSRIAKNKPLPMFLTDGGNFDQRKRAKGMNKYVEGVFYANGVHTATNGQLAFKEGALLGSGMCKVFRGGKGNREVKIERVFTGEITVDEVEAFYGAPMNLYQHKFISRDVLIAEYPDMKQAILDAQAHNPDAEDKLTIDHIKVVEGWHLRSSPDAEDGRHVIAVDGADLFDGEWKRDWFPFPKIDWALRMMGFWARGLAEELIGIQIEINRLLIKIQKAYHLLAHPWILRQIGSQVTSDSLRNVTGTIIDYAGEKPTVVTHNVISPEVYQHLDRLYTRAFEIAGISILSAQSQKPTGLDSGVALRTFEDIESARFLTVGQAYEQFFMDMAKMVVDLTREISAESEDPLTTKVRHGRRIEVVKWKDVELAEEDYIMKVFPVSSLPTSPAGKFQAVIERIQAGMLTKEQGMQLLDFPDLTSETNMNLAALENVDWTISRILDHGEFQPPDPLQNLELGIQRSMSAYLIAMTEGAPADRLDDLRLWMDQAQQMLSIAATPPEVQEEVLPAEVPPPGLPTEPPVSLPPPAAGGPPLPGGNGGAQLPIQSR